MTGYQGNQAGKQGTAEHWKATESLYSSSESRSRYEAYSRLQATAVAFGEKLPIPEIVALGGQSDGKSTLLEALLGFRFNVREVEMGTRRPLMLQMVHDSTALEPRCRLQHEDSEDYGPVIEPPSSVAEAIRERTEEHLKLLGTAVSAKPIVMRAEYAYCPNLTIIDTPGFILKAKKGEPDSTPNDILEMVKAIAAPPHRLLLFLQQSSVEWCSSLWLDTLRAIDPSLRRTTVVVSKFDNRLKEFAERWEVDRYLSAGGYLGETAQPFFVALPKDRAACTNDEFRNQICQVDSEIVKHLRDNVREGFDEDRFGLHIGFGNLKTYLEQELQRRYRDAAPATLALLEERCSEITAYLAMTESRLARSADVASLRRASMTHAAAVTSHVAALLDGAVELDPLEWGCTTEEERSASGAINWPGLNTDIKPPDADMKLYGGAAFERVLNEFRCAACSLECPVISKEKVKNMLLAHAGRGGGVTAAAAGIARSEARSWLGPLLDTACNRLAHVLRSLFDLALECISLQELNTSGKGPSELSAYVTFHAALRKAHNKFIERLTSRCKELVRHHLDTATNPYSQLAGSESQLRSYFPEGTSIKGHYTVRSSRLPVDYVDDASLDEENIDPHASGVAGESKVASAGSPTREAREPLHESQLTIPSTPSPEMGASEVKAKRKEFGLVSGRLSAAGVEGGLRKRTGAALTGRLAALHKEPRHHVQDNGAGGLPRSSYDEVCSSVAHQFGKIRAMLVDRSVPATLNAGFLNPCRESLAMAVQVDLFAANDENFMQMFVAPGAIEHLQKERESLQKRWSILSSCLNEFRNLATAL